MAELPGELSLMLNKLTVEQLDVLIRAAKAKKQFAKTGREQLLSEAGAGRAGTDPHDYVLGVICDVCRELGRDLREVAIAKRNSAYSSFRAAVPAVAAHVKQFAPNRTYEMAIFRAAYRHMAVEYDYGLALLMSNTARVPSMLDEMYPGYYQAGLMSLVIGKLKG